MAKGRDNITESLSDVIELIRTRKQSGLLSVERIEDGRFEEGEIYFQLGRPIHAQAGKITAQEALAWMLTWRKSNFAFVVGTFRPSSSTSSVKTPGESSSVAPISPVTRVVPPSPRAPAPSSLQRNVAREQAGLSEIMSMPGMEWLVPQRLKEEQNIMSLPLTRPQRSIYLLVDGNRTITDLVRCTRKNVQEIWRLLGELQEQGLISL